MSNQQLLLIRNKKLGLLILDARQALRRSVEECAEAIGVSPEQFAAYENGVTAPSLPQLELLALFLNIPLEHFFGKQVLQALRPPELLQEKERLVLLRNRVIGTNLRLARNNANYSLKEMADKTGIAEEKLKGYELGEEAIPVSMLEVVASTLETPLERFFDLHGPIGKWRAQQSSIQHFLDLPPDIQQFACKPVNRPYLELSMRLSELSAEKLRAVAEVLLEITY
jgi:transcriptional regulator with XRE-family HTH domain